MSARRAGEVIAGRYVLARPLASGGMGSVWVATHRDLAVEVAIKFMAASIVASPEARIRFEREARVAARLGSQHVVQVIDYGVDDDTPYMVMELLKGENLSARLKRERRLPLPVAARLVVQVSKALRTAHEAGLVHRDLKPANVFLAQKDDDEVVKVLDFGVAKESGIAEAKAETASGIMLGSIHYMSPEQVRCSRSVDHRSDLWSLGVILYRALTGQLPFPGDIGDVLTGICSGKVPPPSSIAPELPPAVDAFFARALAVDMDRRFPSARELSEAFCCVTLDIPSTPSPSRKWNQTLPMGTAPLALPDSSRPPPDRDDAAADAPTRFMPPRTPGVAAPSDRPWVQRADAVPLYELRRTRVQVPDEVWRQAQAQAMAGVLETADRSLSAPASDSIPVPAVHITQKPSAAPPARLPARALLQVVVAAVLLACAGLLSYAALASGRLGAHRASVAASPGAIEAPATVPAAAASSAASTPATASASAASVPGPVPPPPPGG